MRAPRVRYVNNHDALLDAGVVPALLAAVLADDTIPEVSPTLPIFESLYIGGGR